MDGQHTHGPSGRSLVPAVLAAAAGFAVYHWLHAAELAGAIVLVLAAVVLGWKFRRHLCTAAGFIALACWFTRLAWFFPSSPRAVKRNYWHAMAAHARWRWACRALGLGRPDPHVKDRSAEGKGSSKPHLLHPSVRIYPDDSRAGRYCADGSGCWPEGIRGQR